MQELGKRLGQRIDNFIKKRQGKSTDAAVSERVLSPEEIIKEGILKEVREAKTRIDLHTVAEMGNIQFEIIPELIEAASPAVLIRIMIATHEPHYSKDDPRMIKIRKILSNAEKRRMDGGHIVVDFMTYERYEEILKRRGGNPSNSSTAIE